MWTYSQSTGAMQRPDGTLLCYGYSGFGAGKNKPALQSEPDVGPIPQGMWTIGGAFASTFDGPLVMHLTEQKGTVTFGRTGFMIHGDSFQHPGGASKGCIILARPERLEISGSKDRDLKVTA